MARYLVLHTYDPRIAKSETSLGVMKAILNCFTKDTYCVTSWMTPGAGETACIWEAPSEQAIIDVYPKELDMPVDGIYPATVVDRAEIKKTMAGGKHTAMDACKIYYKSRARRITGPTR